MGGVQVPDENSLTGVDMVKLLDAFFADNLLEYTCEKCECKESRASHSIHRLPRFLVIHCKRFKPNFEKGCYEKLSTKVNVPRELDLARHCSAATHAPPACNVADRISLAPTATAMTSPVKASSILSAADLTCSTVKCLGVKTVTDKSGGGSDILSNLPCEEDLSPDVKTLSRKLTFDKEGGESGGAQSAGRDLDSFLYGGSGSGKRSQQQKYGSGAGKRARVEDTKHRSAKEREEEELQLALKRSMEVTSKSNWMVEDNEQTAKPRVRQAANGGGQTGWERKEERKSSNVRPLHGKPKDDKSKSSEAMVIDDDEDEPLLQRKDTPRKLSTGKVGEGGGKEGKEGFEKANYSLGGDEDEDLQRALALSATVDNGDVDCKVVETCNGDKVQEVSEDEEDTAYVDMCASEDDESAIEGNKTATDTSLPDAQYTLQAVVSHMGKNASHGHYVSDIFMGSKGVWNRYDDAMVSSLNDAKYAQERDWPTQGYLFVYAHNSCLCARS